MVVNVMIENILAFLRVAFSNFSIPEMPAEIVGVLDQIVGYIAQAMPLVWVFLDKKFTSVCLVLALGVMAFEKIYDFVMWVLAKLPVSVDR